jgi:hypothetical protein
VRSRWLLLAWLVGMLFPLAVLGQVWPAFRQFFDAAFGSDWVHIFLHALLFGGLVVLLWGTLGLRFSARAVLLTLGVVLAAAALQEGFQGLSKGLFSLSGSLFDLWVDLFGGLLGLAATWLARRVRVVFWDRVERNANLN